MYEIPETGQKLHCVSVGITELAQLSLLVSSLKEWAVLERKGTWNNHFFWIEITVATCALVWPSCCQDVLGALWGLPDQISGDFGKRVPKLWISDSLGHWTMQLIQLGSYLSMHSSKTLSIYLSFVLTTLVPVHAQALQQKRIPSELKLMNEV